MENKLNRYIPDRYTPFIGADKVINTIARRVIDEVKTENKVQKLVQSLASVFEKVQIKDGMTLSFHHHLRNGDYVMNMVLDEVSKRGIKDITVAASSIFPVHEKMVSLIKDGTIKKIYCNYINGPVAECVSSGYLKEHLVMHTHGGRARAIESGALKIDVAFIAAPTADFFGNATGTEGKSACGVLGYAIPDMLYAKKKIVITDNLVSKVDNPEIYDRYIDYCLKVDSIGDATKIVSGTTKVTTDPVGLKIARNAATLIEELGFITDGFSFQTGAGGTSLAVADEVKKMMISKKVVGAFASGGITGYLTEMLELGLFAKLWDVQCFDLEAVRSYRENDNHIGMSASKYGNPYETDVVVNDLDVVILGATEVDLDFNVNVTTDSNGKLMGGSGGHSDTAYGAKLSIIVTPLMKSRMPIIKDKVATITTPGESVDAIVTERGIAINPKRTDLLDKLKDSSLKIMTIEEMQDKCYEYTGVPEPHIHSKDVVGVVEYRDGTVIDSIYKIEEEVKEIPKFKTKNEDDEVFQVEKPKSKSNKVKQEVKQEKLDI